MELGIPNHQGDKIMNKKLMAVKLSIALILTAVVMPLVQPQIASAHATVQLYGSTATQNGYGHVFIRVPHGKENLYTVKVEVAIPEGVTGVKPQQVGGWKESRVLSEDGKTIKSVIWSEGNLPDTSFQDFGISVKYPNTPGTLYFKTVQTLSDGSEISWVNIPAPGQDSHSLEYPAPSVMVTEKKATHHEAHKDSAKVKFEATREGSRGIKIHFHSEMKNESYVIYLNSTKNVLTKGKLQDGMLMRTVSSKSSLGKNTELLFYIKGKEVARASLK
jgi:uncharacterized protein YcnI